MGVFFFFFFFELPHGEKHSLNISIAAGIVFLCGSWWGGAFSLGGGRV